MNKIIKTSLSAMLFTVAMATIGSSCKKKFDAPPADSPATSLTPNYTIAQLKAKHTVPGNIDRIDSSANIIIRGIVIADDRSGNYYKTLVIQDSTGGLAVLINGTNLFNTLPIGAEVFIIANGLYLSDYSNQIQLGGGIQTGTSPTLADIPTSLLDKNIFRGTLNNVVVPKDVTPAQLTTTMQDKYQNTLIRLSNVEFDRADTAKTYASVGIISPSAASFDLKYCSDPANASIDPAIELRTSNYSTFAGTPLPNGNGTITAIYTVYTRFKQLAIRNPADVQFTGSRCGNGGGTTPPPTGGTVLLSQDFTTVTNNAVLNFTGWNNIGETGGKQFIGKVIGATLKIGYMSAFGSSQPVVTSWLITPPINLAGAVNPTLSFTTSDGFDNGATLKAYISTNYTGGSNPSASTWTLLPATISSGHTTSTYGPFISSGILSLSAYTGNVYIGFKYEGADVTGAGDKTTNYEIDDILVKKD